MEKEKPAAGRGVIPIERITRAILLIRGHKVMLDRDLATLYGVGTRVLNQAVKRNWARFPEDFMFQLTWEEAENPRSQFVILESGKNIKYLPYAFTEQGVAMLSKTRQKSEGRRRNSKGRTQITAVRDIEAGSHA